MARVFFCIWSHNVYRNPAAERTSQQTMLISRVASNFVSCFPYLQKHAQLPRNLEQHLRNKFGLLLNGWSSFQILYCGIVALQSISVCSWVWNHILQLFRDIFRFVELLFQILSRNNVVLSGLGLNVLSRSEIPTGFEQKHKQMRTIYFIT